MMQSSGPPLARASEIGQCLDLEILPRPLMAINGCFDLLHTGHLQLFEAAHQAKPTRATLVLLLDSDRLVRSSKGRDRPILTFIERASAIGSFPYIDYIIEIDSDKEFTDAWKALKPDIRIRGEEYKGKKSRVSCPQTVWVPTLSPLSTTAIADRIIQKWLDAQEV